MPNTEPTAVTLADIDLAAEDYNSALANLDRALQRLEDDLRPIRNHHLPHIRAALKECEATEGDLEMLLRQAKNLFEKPKTRVLHQIRVGWAKSKDTVQAPSDAELIPVIEAVLPEMVEALIEETRKVRKSALNALKPEQMQAIGVAHVKGADNIRIIPQDSGETRLAAALTQARGLCSDEQD